MLATTADIYDQHHQTLHVCELQFRSFGQRRRFFGPCAVVWTYEDHLPVLEAVKAEGKGRVLVVDGGGSLNVGVMGDRIAAVAASNGWTGVVINGAIRDSVAIDQLDLGVKALGVTARRGWTPVVAKEKSSVSFGGAGFSSGQWVYVDEDCVLVSPVEIDLALASEMSAPLTALEVVAGYK